MEAGEAQWEPLPTQALEGRGLGRSAWGQQRWLGPVWRWASSHEEPRGGETGERRGQIGLLASHCEGQCGTDGGQPGGALGL